MGFWKRLLGREKQQTGHRDQEYSVVDIDLSELEKFPDGIGDIKERNIDGFLIRNVLSKAQVETLVKNYELVPDDERSEVNIGMITHPAPFSVVDKTAEQSAEHLKNYHIESEKFWDAFPEKFGVNFVEQVSKALSKISGGRTVRVPKSVDGQGLYNPATFKHLVPGTGEFKAHCGNYFHKEFPSFYEHMKEISQINHQMSYFVMLSPADVGGELTMYEVEWSEAEIRETGDTVLVSKNGRRLDLLDPKSVGRKQIAPNPGDMFVFAGGQIWHKVEKVTGKKPRYTIGGFMTISKDEEALYIWS